MIKHNLLDPAMFKLYLEEKKNLADSSIYIYTQCINKFLIKDPDLTNLEDYNQFIINNSIKKRNTVLPPCIERIASRISSNLFKLSLFEVSFK